MKIQKIAGVSKYYRTKLFKKSTYKKCSPLVVIFILQKQICVVKNYVFFCHFWQHNFMVSIVVTKLKKKRADFRTCCFLFSNKNTTKKFSSILGALDTFSHINNSANKPPLGPLQSFLCNFLRRKGYASYLENEGNGRRRYYFQSCRSHERNLTKEFRLLKTDANYSSLH